MPAANEVPPKKVQSAPQRRPSVAAIVSVQAPIDEIAVEESTDAVEQLYAFPEAYEVELDTLPQVLVQQIMSWAEKSALERAKVQEQARNPTSSKEGTP